MLLSRYKDEITVNLENKVCHLLSRDILLTNSLCFTDFWAGTTAAQMLN